MEQAHNFISKQQRFFQPDIIKGRFKKLYKTVTEESVIFQKPRNIGRPIQVTAQQPAVRAFQVAQDKDSSSSGAVCEQTVAGYDSTPGQSGRIRKALRSSRCRRQRSRS